MGKPFSVGKESSTAQTKRRAARPREARSHGGSPGKYQQRILLLDAETHFLQITTQF